MGRGREGVLIKRAHLKVKEHLCIHSFPFNRKRRCRVIWSDEIILCLPLRVRVMSSVLLSDQITHLVSSIGGLVHLCPLLILLSCPIAVRAAVGDVPGGLRESVHLLIPLGEHGAYCVVSSGLWNTLCRVGKVCASPLLSCFVQGSKLL